MFKKFKNTLNKKKLLTSAMLYTIGTFLLKGINFFTVPIFTHLLTPNDYGIISIYSTWSGIFAIFIGIGINGTIGTAKANLEDDDFKEYLSSTMFLSTVIFIIILLTTIIFNKSISELLDLTQSVTILLIIQSFFAFVINFASAEFTFNQKPIKYLIVSFIITILNIILSIAFILAMNSDKYLGRIYGGAIATIVVGMILYCNIIKKGKKLISIKHWKMCLPIAIPLIFHNLSHLILNQADRIMLQQFINEDAVGVYSFTYNIGIILNIVNMSINSAWVAWYFEAIKNNLKKEIQEKAKLYIMIFTVFTSIFILGSVELTKILAPSDYWSGIGVLPLIILGYYFVFLYTFAVNYEFYKKKTHFIAMGTVIAAIVNIGINAILIPKLGIYAAAISTLIAYIILFIIHELIVRIMLKRIDFPFLYYIYSIMFVALTMVVEYVFIDNLIIRWLLIIVIIIGLILFVFKNRNLKLKKIK